MQFVVFEGFSWIIDESVFFRQVDVLAENDNISNETSYKTRDYSDIFLINGLLGVY